MAETPQDEDRQLAAVRDLKISRWVALAAGGSLVLVLALAAHIFYLRREIDTLIWGRLAQQMGDRRIRIEDTRSSDPRFTALREEELDTDAASLISLRTPADVEARRQAVIRLVWGKLGFSTNRMPALVEIGIKDWRFKREPSVSSVDQLTVQMTAGIDSKILFFHPPKAHHGLVIFHGGHEQDFASSWAVILTFLQKGCPVMAINMPLVPPNSQPKVAVPNFGVIRLTSHDQLAMFDDPLHYFVEPMLQAVNYAVSLGIRDIATIGFSGGAWTVTLYSAVDPRVTRTYPVAGGVPLYLSEGSDAAWSHLESSYMPLCKLASILDLQVMGASGENRRELQVLNQFDNAGLQGIGSRTYLPEVQSAVKSIGPGFFDVWLDRTHFGHLVSDKAIEVIVRDLHLD